MYVIPHNFVWGSCFWFCIPGRLPPASRFPPVTHHLCQTFWHTIFHTPSVTYHLCHIPSFTYNFVTYHVSHTIFHTHVCHIPPPHTQLCVKDGVVKGGRVTKLCVKDGMWQRWYVTDGVWKMVCQKVTDGVWKMVCQKVVCERWRVTKTDGVCDKVVCDKDGCEKWCVKDGMWQSCM